MLSLACGLQRRILESTATKTPLLPATELQAEINTKRQGTHKSTAPLSYIRSRNIMKMDHKHPDSGG